MMNIFSDGDKMENLKMECLCWYADELLLNLLKNLFLYLMGRIMEGEGEKDTYTQIERERNLSIH